MFPELAARRFWKAVTGDSEFVVNEDTPVWYEERELVGEACKGFTRKPPAADGAWMKVGSELCRSSRDRSKFIRSLTGLLKVFP